MPPGREGSWDGRFAVAGRMPEGSCEALFPNDGRPPAAGRVAGDAGTRPLLGRETEPVDGRETLPVEGRETERLDGLE